MYYFLQGNPMLYYLLNVSDTRSKLLFPEKLYLAENIPCIRDMSTNK